MTEGEDRQIRWGQIMKDFVFLAIKSVLKSIG